MDKSDREAIDDLFDKVAKAERQGGDRDPEAEAHIRSKLDEHPAAPYYMGQAIVMLEEALGRSNDRIAQLEEELQKRPAGGFLSGIFGGGDSTVPPPTQRHAHDGRSPSDQVGRGGGFLGSAAGTGMAMIGGAMLGYGLASGFGNDAEAAEAGAEQRPAEGTDDGGGDIGGGAGDFDMDF